MLNFPLMKILVVLNVSFFVFINYIFESIQFLDERVFDGIRYCRRIPSDESTYMALFARTELNRNPERKVIGLS